MNDSNFFSFHISDLRMLAKPIDNYDVLCGCVRESRRFKASVLRHQVFRYALLFRLSKINFTKGWNGAKTASLLFIPRTRGVLSLSVPFFFFCLPRDGQQNKVAEGGKWVFRWFRRCVMFAKFGLAKKRGTPSLVPNYRSLFFPFLSKTCRVWKTRKPKTVREKD